MQRKNASAVRIQKELRLESFCAPGVILPVSVDAPLTTDDSQLDKAVTSVNASFSTKRRLVSLI